MPFEFAGPPIRADEARRESTLIATMREFLDDAENLDLPIQTAFDNHNMQWRSS